MDQRTVHLDVGMALKELKQNLFWNCDFYWRLKSEKIFGTSKFLQKSMLHVLRGSVACVADHLFHNNVEQHV